MRYIILVISLTALILCTVKLVMSDEPEVKLKAVDMTQVIVDQKE